MRNPNRRMRIPAGIGQRGAPWPPSDDKPGGRTGSVVNHDRGGRWQSAMPVPFPAAAHDPADAARTALMLQGIQALSIEDSAASAAPVVAASALLLAQSQVQDLLAANRRKDEFLALLAHELRSPLCAIGYAAGLLSARMTDGGALPSLPALIERQVVRMTHLVDEVLDVSRVTHGLLTLQSVRVDLCLIITNAIETLQSDIKGRDQCLTAHMPDMPLWVTGDERRLEQVLVNLIANASRYTDKGGKLTVLAYVEAEEAVIRIRDSGIGISPSSLPGIFQLFRQADSSDPRSKAGLGVGLALVRQLVELHGGKVTAASEGVGRGSVFTITLPVFPVSCRVPTDTGADNDVVGVARTNPVECPVPSGTLLLCQ